MLHRGVFRLPETTEYALCTTYSPIFREYRQVRADLGCPNRVYLYIYIYRDGRSAGQIEFLYLFPWDKLKPEILFGIASSRF